MRSGIKQSSRNGHGLINAFNWFLRSALRAGTGLVHCIVKISPFGGLVAGRVGQQQVGGVTASGGWSGQASASVFTP
jgi:hypothetical protein